MDPESSITSMRKWLQTAKHAQQGLKYFFLPLCVPWKAEQVPQLTDKDHCFFLGHKDDPNLFSPCSIFLTDVSSHVSNGQGLDAGVQVLSVPEALCKRFTVEADFRPWVFPVIFRIPRVQQKIHWRNWSCPTLQLAAPLISMPMPFTKSNTGGWKLGEACLSEVTKDAHTPPWITWPILSGDAECSQV